MKAFNSYDIKQSIEYKWRIKMIGVYILLFAFGCAFSVPVALLCCIPCENYYESCVRFCTIFAGAFSIISLLPALVTFILLCHFLTTYLNYKPCEAILDRPHEYLINLAKDKSKKKINGSLYFTVLISDGDKTIEAKTNDCFTSRTKSKLWVNHFIGKKVTGLYNEKRKKFYIVKVIE